MSFMLLSLSRKYNGNMVRPLSQMFSRSNRSSNMTGCKIVSSSSSLAVLKLDASVQQKNFSGKSVSISSDKEGLAEGIVVLQRLPLLFVYGNFSQQVLDNVFCENVTISPGDVVRLPLNTIYQRISGSEPKSGVDLPIFSSCPDVAEIQTIKEPFHTGITAVDVLTPIGKGQNMLFAGDFDSNVSKLLNLICASGSCKCNNNTVKYVTISDSEPSAEFIELDAEVVQLQSNELFPKPNKEIACDSANPTEANIAATIGAEHWLMSNVACSVGSDIRRSGGDSVVLFNYDLKYLEKLWSYSTFCLEKYVICDNEYAASSEYTANGDNSEKRLMYASLFQQVGKYSDELGGGSMTILCRIDNNDAPASGEESCEFNADARGDVEYTLGDFKNCQFLSFNAKTISRLELLVSKNIRLTPEVLRKINIPEPVERTGMQVSTTGQRNASMNYIYEISSLTDGHIIMDSRNNSWSKEESTVRPFDVSIDSPPLIPYKSLSRVGARSKNKKRINSSSEEAKSKDVVVFDSVEHLMHPALKLVSNGGHLRYELSQINDMMPGDVSLEAEQVRLRAVSWLCAMQQPSSNGLMELMPLSHQVVLLLAVETGLYDNVIQFKLDQYKLATDAGTMNWNKFKSMLVNGVTEDSAGIINDFNQYIVRCCDDKRSDCMQEIENTADLTDACREALKKEIQICIQQYINNM